MTKPVSIQQRIRILDAQGVSWREIARRLGVSRDTVRKYATMEDCSPKPAAGKGRRSLIDAYSGTVDSWLSADGLMPRKQRHTARRVYARLVEEEELRGLVLVGAALREEVARGASVRRRRLSRARLERRRHAGRFRRGRRHDRRGDVKVHCLVATFPHSNMRYVAAMPGENAECVCEGLPDLRPHRHGSPRAGARQRHRCGPPRRVEQGDSGARVRHVLRPLPARDKVPRPVFRQREGLGRERGRLPAPQPHGPQAQRGEPQAAGEASAVEARRDRGRGPLLFRQADTRAVRRGPRGDAAAAARVSTRSNGSSARPTRRATSRSARSVTSRARHGAAGRCSRACARSRWRSAPPTAGT